MSKEISTDVQRNITIVHDCLEGYVPLDSSCISCQSLDAHIWGLAADIVIRGTSMAQQGTVVESAILACAGMKDSCAVRSSLKSNI